MGRKISKFLSKSIKILSRPFDFAGVFFERIHKKIGIHWLWFVFALFIVITWKKITSQSLDHQSMDYLRISTWNIKSIFIDNYGDQLPFWFILLKGYTAVFGRSEIALRVLAVVTLFITSFLILKLAKLYKVNEFWPVVFYLFNPLVVQDSAYENKHWSFLVLVALLSLYIFEMYLRAKKKRYLILLLFVVWCGLYTNFVFLFFFIAFLPYVVWKLHKEPGLAAASFAIAGYLVAPIYLFANKAQYQLYDVQGPHVSEWGVKQKNLAFIARSILDFTGTTQASVIISVIIIVLFACLVVFFVVSATLAIKTRKITNILPALLCLLVVTLVVVGMAYLGNKTPVRMRYLTSAIPFFYLFIFFFLRQKPKIFVLFPLVLFTVVSISFWGAVKHYKTDDWRAVANIVKPQLKPDSKIGAISSGQYTYVADYYLGRPVQGMNDFNDIDSLQNFDDIWIIHRAGGYDKFLRLASDYQLTTDDQIKGFTILHFAKKADRQLGSTNLIFRNPNITIGDKKCSFKNGELGKDCYKEDWQKIKLDNIKSGTRSEVCLFTHPRDNNPITLDYADIQLKRSIEVRTAIEEGMATGDRSPVYMDVFINGEKVELVITPDKTGWLSWYVNTDRFNGQRVDLKLVIYSDYDNKRHYCWNAEFKDEPVEATNYFIDNIKAAKVFSVEKECKDYKNVISWPHNEKTPPFRDSKIFGFWNCDENYNPNRIWNLAGTSFATSGGVFKEAIWFHPAQGQQKRLVFDNIKEPAKKLSGYFGLNDYVADMKIENSIRFYIRINDEAKKYTFNLDTGKTGWEYFNIDSPNEIKKVEFEVTAGNDRWAHFFFNAFLN